MSKEQARQAHAVGEKYARIAQQVSAYAAPVGGAFISTFLWGTIIWLVGTKALGGSFQYMKAVEVAGLSNMISVLDAVVKTLLIIGMGNIFASPSLALLVKDFNPQNPAHSALAMVNVMSFWSLGVRSLGMARLSGASFLKCALWVFGLWGGYTGAMIGIASAVQMVFNR